MSNDVTGQVAEPTDGEQVQNNEDFGKKVAELTAQLEIQKKEIAGLNRAVSEKEKILLDEKEAAEKAAREKMSDIERLRQDVDKWQREATLKENTALAKDFLHENNLPIDFLDMLDVSDSEKLEASFPKVQAIADKLRKSEAESFAKQHGQAPPKGSGSVAGSESKVQALREAGDLEGAKKAAIFNAISKAKQME